jgi:hypothetical protein
MYYINTMFTSQMFSQFPFKNHISPNISGQRPQALRSLFSLYLYIHKPVSKHKLKLNWGGMCTCTVLPQCVDQIWWTKVVWQYGQTYLITKISSKYGNGKTNWLLHQFRILRGSFKWIIYQSNVLAISFQKPHFS